VRPNPCTEIAQGLAPSVGSIHATTEEVEAAPAEDAHAEAVEVASVLVGGASVPDDESYQDVISEAAASGSEGMRTPPPPDAAAEPSGLADLAAAARTDECSVCGEAARPDRVVADGVVFHKVPGGCADSRSYWLI
jgi:hypothetical protein